MSTLDLLRARRDELLRLAGDHGAYNVRIFGSVARGEDREDSDIDILVALEPGTSLLEFAGLSVALQDLLGVSVDVVSERGLSPHLRVRILSEAVPL